MTHSKLVPSLRRLVGFLSCFCSLSLALVAAEPAKRSFNLPAGNADQALKRLSEQSGREVLFPADAVEGVQTKAVKGEMTPQEALDAMLSGTPLVGVQDEKTGSLTVRRETSVEKAEKNDSSRPGNDRAAGDKVEGTIKLDTFEVMGPRSLNMDIPRSRDDAQPYVIMDRVMIEQSGATTVEDFLKNRLTQNAARQVNGNVFTTAGNVSTINLRGLGANQTLILIDGHRAAGISNSGAPAQTDLNGIPLAAVERIEVLPATASGIYGGSATGGVVNIILRRNYVATELKLTYENSFSTDTALRRIDLSSGFTLLGGKTHVMLNASWSDQNGLMRQDRAFLLDYRKRVIANGGGDPTILSVFSNGITSPPQGSTPNIRSFDGSNLVLKTGTALNSPITYVPNGYTGIQADQGAALVANAGNYNVNWGQSRLPSPGGGEFGMTNAPQIRSILANIRQQFGSRIEAFLDLGYSENYSRLPITSVDTAQFSPVIVIPSSAPSNPFQQSIEVQAPIASKDLEQVWTKDGRAVIGVVAKLPAEWMIEADFLVDQSSTRFRNDEIGNPTAFTADIISGAVPLIRDTRVYPIDMSAYTPIAAYTVKPAWQTMTDATLRVAGPVLNLPAGPVHLAGTVDNRRERSTDSFSVNNATTTTYNPGRDQSVESAYLELRGPVVSPAQSIPLVRSLEFQLAGRWDDYTIHGATASITNGTTASVVAHSTNRLQSTNPTIAMEYKPVDGILLRASYGTGFLPPTVNQVLPTVLTSPVTIIDPKRGNTSYAIPAGGVSNGGSPNLRPEKSKSTSVGIILTPKALPGFRLALDYTQIHKTDNIVTLVFQQFVDNEALFPGRITRGANLPTDQPGWAGPITVLDATQANILKAQLEAYDLTADYGVKTAEWGSFNAYAVMTWSTHFKQQFALGGPLIDAVGYTNGPLKYRANFGLTWIRNRWTLGWNGRYFGPYYVWSSTTTPAQIATANPLQGNGGRVQTQVYHDVFGTYRFGSDRQGWRKLTAGTEVTVGVKNVLNTTPPYDNSLSQYRYSFWGDARLATYYVSLKHSF